MGTARGPIWCHGLWSASLEFFRIERRWFAEHVYHPTFRCVQISAERSAATSFMSFHSVADGVSVSSNRSMP